jgi:protein PhnA
MSLSQDLHARSGSVCELCGATENLETFAVAPKSGDVADDCILACGTCIDQIQNPEQVNPNHWRCLNDSMWSTVPAVQVVAWRMLDRLRGEGWPADLIDQMYLDDATLAWAQTVAEPEELPEIHMDAHGAVLQAGDTVILTQSLDVKGANFTAKRGTAVRGISLVEGNTGQIEGKVNGMKIVILTKFVKKSS